MFSTASTMSQNDPVDTPVFVHIDCGGDSPMKPGKSETYTQSTGPTTTTTLLYL